MNINKFSLFAGLFLAGVFLGSVFNISFYDSIFLFFISFIFLIIYFFKKDKLFLIVFFIFFSITLGIFRVYSYNSVNSPLLDSFIDKNIEVYGTIVSEPLRKESYTRYVLKTDYLLYNNKKYIVNQKVLVYDDVLSEFTYGNKVVLRGKLKIPKNIYDENSLKNNSNFDWVLYLKKDSIFYEMFFPNTTLLNEYSDNFLIRTKQFLIETKYNFIQNIKNNIPLPESSLASGEVFGAKNFLGKDLENKLRRTGIIHVVVLSGYNITIVADFIFKTLSFLSSTLSFYFGLFGIVMFAIFTGGSPTIVRASIMAILVLMARRYGKVYDNKNALLFAGFIMVALKPNILLFDPSFQLSFLATLGLIYLSPQIEKRILNIIKFRYISEIFSATVSTQLFVLPLIVYLMGEISIVSVVVNILVLPVVPITMLFSFLTALFGFISTTFSLVFGFISTIFLSYQLFIVDIFSSMPFSSVSIPKNTALLILLFYILTFVLFIYKKHESKRK